MTFSQFTNVASPRLHSFFSCILVTVPSDCLQKNKANCQALSVWNVIFDLELKSVAAGFWPVFYVAEAQNC